MESLILGFWDSGILWFRGFGVSGNHSIWCCVLLTIPQHALRTLCIHCSPMGVQLYYVHTTAWCGGGVVVWWCGVVVLGLWVNLMISDPSFQLIDPSDRSIGPIDPSIQPLDQSVGLVVVLLHSVILTTTT